MSDHCNKPLWGFRENWFSGLFSREEVGRVVGRPPPTEQLSAALQEKDVYM